MNEELKYFELHKDGLDSKVIIACKPEQVEDMRSKFKDCELTECEKPENAQIIPAEPNINPAPFIMHNPYYDLAEPGVRNTIYDGPNCAKCANRFRRNDWCNQHFRNTGNCYRFKYKP